MSKVIVIGAGAAGMIAAIRAAGRGKDVCLLEKNEKPGKKLFITGKGRCNLTNACDTEELFLQVVSNPKFLYSAFYSFSNFDVIDFFHQAGLPTKVERGGRVFPLSDKSSDVIAALTRRLEASGADVRYHSEVTDIRIQEDGTKEVVVNGKKTLQADALIIATGGLSYPVTGSTGDGYRFAQKAGHKITKLSPSLVPFEIKEAFVKELMGLSLKNVEIRVEAGKKEIYRAFGEMLFTHFGVSGPLILSASAYAVPWLDKNAELSLKIDLKPALSIEQLDARILREFQEMKNKSYKNSLERLLPKKLISVIISLSEIHPDKKVNEITKEERRRLLEMMKGMPLTITGIRGYHEAIITKGGISVKDINPSTMESKLVKGMYFAGEILDLDALTGGFNLQIAWSTGYLAGSAAE